MSTSSLYDLETLFLEKLQEKYKLNIRDVKRAFARFDLDQNGLLDLSEMVKGVQTFLNGVKETQVKALVDCYDVNGDGKISYEEFLHFLTTRSAIDPYDEEAEELPDEEYYAPVSANRGGSRGGGRPGSRQGGYQDEGYSQASSRYRDEDNASYRSGGQYSDASYHPHYAEDDRSQGRGRAAAPVQRAQAAPVGRGRAPANGAARKEAWQDRETYSEVGTDIVPSSEVPSTLNEGNPRELENRAKVFIHNLKNALSKKASDMRLSGKVRMPTMMTIPELHESVARDLLAKQFQPFTGEGDGRVRGKAFGVEFSDFAK